MSDQCTCWRRKRVPPQSCYEKIQSDPTRERAECRAYLQASADEHQNVDAACQVLSWHGWAYSIRRRQDLSVPYT